MSKTITINNIDFRNDCIDFRVHMQDNSAKTPTSQCFIHVWQKSSDFDNFEANLKSLWSEYVSQHPENNSFSLSFVKTSMQVRASIYRGKGVELKRFPRKPNWNAKDWKSLADLADASL
tara:strand:+ start:170 stop:526 length:357 start_codon:yes stop_codon:yes gene_type:complete